jgi:hypothetical protein
MFDERSRYRNVPETSLTAPDGRVIAYKQRRFLPRPEDMAIVAELAVGEGDRPDLLAAKAFGDPELYWRLCDANDVLDPAELTAETGRRLRVPAPEV